MEAALVEVKERAFAANQKFEVLQAQQIKEAFERFNQK